MKRIVFSLILAGFSGLLSCAQQNSAADLALFVKQKADSNIAKTKVPGILIFYSNKGEKGFYTTGYADPATQKKFDENTFFEIGSITKTFTAYVLMSVLRDHKIPDTASILPYLPEEVQQNKALSAIRFVNLVNHTSGLPRMPGNMEIKDNDLQPYATYDSKKLFEYLATAKPSDKKQYEYSNLGAGIAGVLAERIAKKTYAALLDQYIFLPFKMVDKNNTIEKSDNKSQGYLDDTTRAAYWNMNVLAPAGGLKCTAAEMSRYLQLMSNPYNEQSRIIIDSLTSVTHTLSPIVSIGRGWHSFTLKNKPVIYWHNGGTYGFSTFAAFIKGTGQWVMVVVNHFDKNDTVSDRIGMQVMNKMIE